MKPPGPVARTGRSSKGSARTAYPYGSTGVRPNDTPPSSVQVINGPILWVFWRTKGENTVIFLTKINTNTTQPENLP
jgi:hypothetical protein